MTKHRTAPSVSWTINGLTLELAPKTLALRRLLRGDRVWLDNGDTGVSPWQLHVADALGQRVDLECGVAKSATARLAGDTLCLDWRGVADKASGAGPFDVRVTIAPAAAGANLTAWRLTVKNRSRTWTLWHLLFPRLCGLTPGKHPETESVFWPEMWGMQATGWDKMTEVAGACGGYGKHSAQFMGFSRAGHTLYMGAYDPQHWQKMMVFRPEKPAAGPRRAQLHFLAYPSGMTEAGNGYAQSYDVVVGEVAGDWYDVSRVYAGFARQQAWVSAPPALASREPREERELLVWEQASVNAFPKDRVVSVNGMPPAKWVQAMTTLRQRLGVRLAVHIYHWHQTPFDTNYPDYFPVKAGFKELAAKLKAADIVLLPYINGRLYDINAASYDRTAARWVAKTSGQRVAPGQRPIGLEHYGNGQHVVGMCMHSPFWQQKIVALCKRITGELSCGGVYLDQLGCFGGGLCLDPSHGHPLGGGDYWLAGYRKLLASVRQAIGPKPYLTTENNWEGCVADFDALLDTQWNHEMNLPIFPTVYWGRGAIYGGDVFAPAFADGGDTFIQRLGMRCVWGGELGWGHFEHLLKKENRHLLEYFTGLCRVRAEFARFFCRGEFLRPPKVTLAATGEPCTNPLKGPVLAAMWADPDVPACAAIMLVNVTRKPQRVRVCVTDPRWPLAAGSRFEAELAPLSASAVLSLR